MKKLLAMVLVLGVAAIVNAAPIVNVDGAAVIGGSTNPGMLSIVAGEPTSAWDIKFDFSGVEWSGVPTYPTTFDFAGKIIASDSGMLRVGASQFFSPAVPAGSVLMTGVDLAGEGTVSVYSMQGTQETLIGTFDVVPEPITMSLLGLGGLVALRRRHA